MNGKIRSLNGGMRKDNNTSRSNYWKKGDKRMSTVIDPWSERPCMASEHRA